MQKITLIVVGALKTPWIAEGCDEYLDRLLHGIRLQVIEIPASKKKDEAQQRTEESDRILEALKKTDGKIWVLDEKGNEMTSMKFAETVGKFRDLGESITFVIGGAYGMNDAVRGKAEKILRLSAMTFPHELCRLVFLEQLYRAISINAGSGYHH